MRVYNYDDQLDTDEEGYVTGQNYYIQVKYLLTQVDSQFPLSSSHNS